MEEKVFSVSEFITLLNIGLKKSKARIVGEVGKIDVWPTGHISFPLRDEKDQSIINCIIWKSRYRMFNIELKDGLKVIVSGYPEIYNLSGRLSVIIETIEYAGEGALKQEYERLKKKLAEEGMFEKSKKRPIPEYLQKIGLITSLKGAVIADFSNNLKKHGFRVTIIDSRVEGQAAVLELLASIKTLRKKNIEALVIIRGGGSMESMLAFNNELLIREVAAFPVPVIVGIGHHKDEPLVALAADGSESTPTAVANCLNESWDQATLFLERYERDIIGNYEDALDKVKVLIDQSIDAIREAGHLIFDKYKTIEDRLKISFQNFKNTLLNIKIDLNKSLNRSLSGFRLLLSRVSQKLKQAEKVIALNSPEHQLRLGYSIAFCGNKIIRRTGDAKIGDNIDLRVIDGTIISKVKNINKK